MSIGSDNQRVNINSVRKRLNEAVSPAGGGWGWTVEGNCLTGYSHFLDVVLLKDEIKENVEVLRFTDKQVLKAIQNVIAEIEKNIEEFERQDAGKFAKVHPQPPPAGDIAIAQGSDKSELFSPEL